MTPTTPTAADVSAEELKLKTLIERYWNLAHAEGAEGRTHDTPDGAAMKTYQAINEAIDELKAALLASAAGGQAEPVGRVGVGPFSKQGPTWFEFIPGKKLPDGVHDLYTAPSPPVGELQGVTDEEVKAATRELQAVGDWLIPPGSVRRALEFFAASRPVACAHRFMHFGDQPTRRCADCNLPEPVAGGVTDEEILKAAGTWASDQIGDGNVVRICRQVLNFATIKAGGAS